MTFFTKKIWLVIFLFFDIASGKCQDTAWYTYTLDSLVTVDLPGNAYENDTVLKGMELHQLYSSFNNTIFIVQKLPGEKKDTDANLSRLPYDLESLEDFYNGTIEGMIKKNPYQLQSKNPVTLNNFKGYNLVLSDSLGHPKYEVQFFLLNKYLYSQIYINETDFDEHEKMLFFNSFTICNIENINQFPGKSRGYRIGYLIGKYSLFVIVVLVIMIIAARKKKKNSKKAL